MKITCGNSSVEIDDDMVLWIGTGLGFFLVVLSMVAAGIHADYRKAQIIEHRQEAKP